jgi:N-methylhydantoinase A/oxoprolinase/acetone carboxylase beta subunit
MLHHGRGPILLSRYLALAWFGLVVYGSLHPFTGWRDTGVWSRLALPAGAVIEGPAILEQPDATTVIEPDHVGRVDALGNVIVEPK